MEAVRQNGVALGFAAEELWRGGVHATTAGAARAESDGGDPSGPLVAWVAALVRHCNDSDLDLSSSLDASIDFSVIAPTQKPEQASENPRAQESANEPDVVGISGLVRPAAGVLGTSGVSPGGPSAPAAC